MYLNFKNIGLNILMELFVAKNEIEINEILLIIME